MTETVATLTYQEPIGTGGNREDLSDLLWDISPTETPGISAMGRTRATATNHEWLTDVLGDAGDNKTVEGADAVIVRPASRTRLGNYTQILSKTAAVSGTQERVLKGGGIKSEMAYQIARRMKEIKRDLEYLIYGMDNSKVAGNESTAREMGSFSSYIVDGFAGGATGVAPDGNGVLGSYAAGTPRAFDETILTTALENLWNRSGGNENLIAIMGSKQRGIFSSFTGADTRYVTTDDRKLVASIDVYDGDFHTITATPDRFCLATNVFIQDSEYVKLAELRSMQSYDLAKVGDSVRKQIVWEVTLEMCNPDAHVNIAALS
jgi:hypothetical protein